MTSEPEWMRRAACQGRTALFYPHPDENGRDGIPRALAREAQCRAICEGCPVRRNCFAMSMALPDSDEGFYAGLTAKQRRRVLRQL